MDVESLALSFDYLFEDSKLSKLVESRNLKSKHFYALFEDILSNYIEDHKTFEVNITLPEFYNIVKTECEKLKYPLDKVVQAFEALDNDCLGKGHELFLESLVIKSGMNQSSALIDTILSSFSYSTQLLGPVDVFCDSQTSALDKMIDFVFRNRCEFKYLLPGSDKKLVEKFEWRMIVVEVLLKEFYKKVCRDTDKPQDVKETSPKMTKSKLKEDAAKDVVSISFSWLLKMISSISSVLVADKPGFAEEAVNHTRWALNLLDFFQLNQNHSPEQSGISNLFSKGVIEELRCLSYNLTREADSKEIHLWLEFIYGDVGRILDIILSDALPATSDLVNKLKNARNQVFQKESILLDLGVESDGVRQHTPLSDKIRGFTTQIGSTCLHILSHEIDQFAIKHLQIKVGQDPTEIKIFICDNENFRLQDLKEKQQSCSLEDLGLCLMGSLSSKSKGDLTFSFDRLISGKKILVRFESSGGYMTNIGVGFYGLSLPASLANFVDNIEKENKGDLSTESLLFLSCTASCQYHKVTKPKKTYNFSTFSNARIDDDTGILTTRSDNFAMISAWEPLSKDNPYFEIEVITSKSTEVHVGLVSHGFNSSSLLPGHEPYSVAYNGGTGGFNDGSTSAVVFDTFVNPKDKVKWRLELQGSKTVVIFQKNGGPECFRKEFPENATLYPAVAFNIGSVVKLLNKEPWRAKQDDDSESLSWLNVENVTIEVFLKLVKKFKNNKSMLASTLHLMHHLIPFISTAAPKEVIQELLDLICNIVDEQEENNDIVDIFKNILFRGVKLFFADKLESLDLSHKEISTKRSSGLIFEALCKHVGEHDPQVLLCLPEKISDDETERIICLMKRVTSLLSIKSSLKNQQMDFTPNPSFLRLLSSLQSLIFAWCSRQVLNDEPAVYRLIANYLRILLEVAIQEINMLDKMGDVDLAMALKENLLLSTSFRQLLILIGQSCDWLKQTSKNNLLDVLKMILLPIKNLVVRLSADDVKKWDVFCDSTTMTSVHWLRDVTASVFHLFGKLCGLSIQIIPEESVLVKMMKGQERDDLLISDIWRLIFRAGLQSSGRQEIQRSLSGKHGAVIESGALVFLLSLNEEENEVSQKFIKRCQVLAGKINLAGSSHVTSAVVALFAALIWHTQPIRESLESYIVSNVEDEIPEVIVHAYKAAEILRMPMMKKRQDLIEEKFQKEDGDENNGDELKEFEKNDDEAEEGGAPDGESTKTSKTFVCENCPISDIKSKSEFLLQFAGLKKMQATEKKQPKLAGSSVDKAENLKQSDLLAMYPSFQLVLNFVKDPLWNQAQIENLLETRRGQAIMLARGYRHIRDFMTTFDFEDVSSKVAKLCVPSFLGGLLEGQDFFPKHHLDFIDGCGLVMETKVRQEFYRLIKLMVSTSSQLVTRDNGNQIPKADFSEYNDCVIAATIHLLNVNWQNADLNTLVESDTVDFLLSIMLGSKASESIDCVGCELSLEEELNEYSKHMSWLKTIETVGLNDFKYPRTGFVSKKDEKDKYLFVSRYQLKCDIAYRCDYCSKSVKVSKDEGYYRCTECNDFDICTTCVKKQFNQARHMTFHKIVFLKHVCKGCQGAILNTMHTCDQCLNIQWCTGCVLTKNFNHEGHNSNHVLSMEKLPPVSHQKVARASVGFYNKCHASVQLCNIALRSLECVTSTRTPKERRKSVGDFDYQRAAESLYEGCIKGTLKVLMATCQEVDAEKWKDDVEGERMWYIEDALFGLLARLLPPDEAFSSLWKVWTDGKIISTLIEIIFRYEDKDVVDNKLMALTLLKRIVQTIDSLSYEEIENFVNILLEFGSGCLNKGQLDCCTSVIEVIRAPAGHLWRKCLGSKIEEKINHFNRESNKLQLVFYALILTGLPKSLSFGSDLCYYKSEEYNNRVGIILRLCVEDTYEVIDLKTRQKCQVQKGDVVHSPNKTIPLNLPLELLPIIQSVFQQLDDVAENYEQIDLWFLCILIKAQSELMVERDDKSRSALQDILPKIVRNYLDGSKLSQTLMVSDIESLVASLIATKGDSKHAEEDSLVGSDPLADVQDSDLKFQFEMLSEDDNILDRFICRAIYNLHRDNREMIAEVLMNTVSSSILSEEVKEALEKVEAKYKSKSVEGEEIQLEDDLGISLNLCGLNVKQEDELLGASGLVMEDGILKPAKVISSKPLKEDNQKKQQIEVSKRNDSLIKKSLERAKSDEKYKNVILKKATKTMMTMNCKHFLTNLLLNMNFEEMLKFKLVNNQQLTASPSNEELWCSLVIFIISTGKDEHLMRQLLKNVLSSSSQTTLEQLINMAHNFMLDLTIVQSVDLKENDGQGFVEVNGADYLVLQFPDSQDTKDQSSSLSCRLLISSTAAFDPVIHSLPISNPMSIELQDNKFYYKVEGGTTDKKFNVIRKTKRKELFSGGFEVLQYIINDPNLFGKVRKDNMWIRLLKLFYESTSSKRIKILSLILKISTSEHSDVLDLTFLNHAWSYYKRMAVFDETKTNLSKDDIMKPAIFLGLTELFASLAGNLTFSNVISAISV